MIMIKFSQLKRRRLQVLSASFLFTNSETVQEEKKVNSLYTKSDIIQKKDCLLEILSNRQCL